MGILISWITKRYVSLTAFFSIKNSNEIDIYSQNIIIINRINKQSTELNQYIWISFSKLNIKIREQLKVKKKIMKKIFNEL